MLGKEDNPAHVKVSGVSDGFTGSVLIWFAVFPWAMGWTSDAVQWAADVLAALVRIAEALEGGR